MKSSLHLVSPFDSVDSGAAESSIARLVRSWTQQGESSPRFLQMPIGVSELDRGFPDPQPHHAGEKQHPDEDLCDQRQASHPVPDQVQPLPVHNQCDNEPDPPHRENHDGVGAEYSCNNIAPKRGVSHNHSHILHTYPSLYTFRLMFRRLKDEGLEIFDFPFIRCYMTRRARLRSNRRVPNSTNYHHLS